MNNNELKGENKNHTSHFALHTSQKGITLIALIITIIVMLILVGVTINVSLNGGLFTKASEASKQMQVEADRETLLSAVVAAIGYDGKVVLGDIELPTGWTGADGTYTSPKGNSFTVDENGKIEAGKEGAIPTPEQPEKELPPTLTAMQIDKGKYSDYAIIELDVTFQSEEQAYKTLEYAVLEETGIATIEEFFLAQYNYNADTPVERFEDIGMTVEECMTQLLSSISKKEDFNDKVIVALNSLNGITYSVKRPDSSVYTSEGITLRQYLGEGIGGLNHDVWFYAAPETGTYEITITIGEYELTDTVTVESI